MNALITCRDCGYEMYLNFGGRCSECFSAANAWRFCAIDATSEPEPTADEPLRQDADSRAFASEMERRAGW